MVAELTEITLVSSTATDEVRTATLNALAAILADEIVLMVDDQGAVEAGVIRTAGAAYYKQVLDVAKEKADAVNARNAAIAASAAAAAAVAAGVAAGAGNRKGGTMNPLAGTVIIPCFATQYVLCAYRFCC